jgi:hypothetical protein
MGIRIFNTLLILFAVYMGLKQGWAMISGKPAMLEMFERWNFGRTAIAAFGGLTLLSAALILFPATFLWGNFLMAASILLIACLQLQEHHIKGAAIELPFLLLNLLIIYLQHPLAQTRLK